MIPSVTARSGGIIYPITKALLDEYPNFNIVQSSPTNDDTLDLTLSAVGATEMSIGVGACSIAWQPYSPTAVVNLSVGTDTDQDFELFVRFRDALKNTTDCPATGKTIEMRACQVVDVADGKARGIRQYLDMATMTTQLGVNVVGA